MVLIPLKRNWVKWHVMKISTVSPNVTNEQIYLYTFSHWGWHILKFYRDWGSQSLMDSSEITDICTHSLACYGKLQRCRTPTNSITHAQNHTVCPGKYHETLLTRMVLQIGWHGQEEHLELISLRCFDKSFGADFRLTIQTLLIHRKHICLLPIPVVNNQQVRWGCIFSPYFSSLFC